MRTNIICVGFFAMLSFSQSSIYDIQVESINGTTISMNVFANKKILITTISSLSPDIQQLSYLDSLQNNDTSLRVLAIPAKDISGEGNDILIASLVDSLGLEISVFKSAFVKKSAGVNQHQLFKWLTNVNENSHFDIDAESIGQFFIVSKTGILYSVLGNDVPADILNQTLNQVLNE